MLTIFNIKMNILFQLYNNNTVIKTHPKKKWVSYGIFKIHRKNTDILYYYTNYNISRKNVSLLFL